MTDFNAVKDALVACDVATLQGLVKDAVDAGLPAQEILDKGLIAGMDIVGEKMESGSRGNLQLTGFSPLLRGIGFDGQGMDRATGDLLIQQFVNELVFLDHAESFESITDDGCLKFTAIAGHNRLTVFQTGFDNFLYLFVLHDAVTINLTQCTLNQSRVVNYRSNSSRFPLASDKNRPCW